MANVLEWPSQSHDLTPTEHVFHLLKTKLKAKALTQARCEAVYSSDLAEHHQQTSQQVCLCL